MQKPAVTKKKYTRAQSRDWFKGLARNSYSIRKNIMTGKDGERYRTNITPGKMYFFYYDPKHKATLQVYDRFPLVFPFALVPEHGGFLGLNLHFLSVGQRDKLIDLLMRYANNTTMDENTKLALSWKAVTATAQMRGLSERCVKMYLLGHVRSRFVEIHADEWYKVTSLDVQDMVQK